MKKTNRKNCEEYLFEWTRFDEATETDVPAQTLITFTYDYEPGYTSLNHYEPNEPDYIEITIHETEGDELTKDAYNDATYEIENILLEELAA